MFQIEVTQQDLFKEIGGEEGRQEKFKQGPYWYKLDHYGREGRCEYLVSTLLGYSSLAPEAYVRYEPGTVNGKNACRSRDFLKQGEELLSFSRLYHNLCGGSLLQVIEGMHTVSERVDFVVDFVKESCDLDVRDYLSRVFTLAMLVLDEGRHLNNLAVIWDGRAFKTAPIFDNGDALLNTNLGVRARFSMPENVAQGNAGPFSVSFTPLFQYLGRGFTVDYEGALSWLSGEEDSREKDVLLYQLDRYRKLLDAGTKTKN